jgi:predicted small lipoprotein YifL
MRYVVISLLLLLSACGQRGPLYLPEEKQPEAVMSTGDESGQTDEETDWTESGDAPRPDNGEKATAPGDADETKDRKKEDSPSGTGRQD